MLMRNSNTGQFEVFDISTTPSLRPPRWAVGPSGRWRVSRRLTEPAHPGDVGICAGNGALDTKPRFGQGATHRFNPAVCGQGPRSS